MAEEQETAVPEGLELHKNGTITAVFEDQRVHLRRPRVGEFRKLRELLHEAEDRLEPLAAPVRAAGAALRQAKKDEDEDAAVTALRDYSAANRPWVAANEVENIGWMRVVFDMLGTAPLPPDDELPLWVMNGETLTTIVNHWREVPPARGVD